MDDLIDQVADDVEKSFSIDFRDPYKRPYGNPEKTTPSQEKSWRFLREHNVWRQAMIGAKGSGKSYGGAAFCFYFGQEFPGAKGACVGNTDRQAKDAAGEHFVNMAKNLGFRTEYFGSKKINGQQYSKFYIVDLDGEGYEEGLRFMLFIRAMESVDSMEGSEFDFMWVEEIQHAEKQPFVKATSRNRGTHIAGNDLKNPLYVAGMTGGKTHWMYSMLEDNMGFETEESFDPEEDEQVLFEPVLTENVQNIGQATIDGYYETFDATKAERLIHARRVSKNQDRALYEYRDAVHTSGKMSKILCHYDPYDDLIISFDFNVSPMCVSAWQKKPWNDAWRSDNVQLVWNDAETQIEEVRIWDDDEEDPSYESFESLEDWKGPDAEALAQVDEWEVWKDDEYGGGTRGTMRHIVEDYADIHHGQVIILGDAQGNSDSTSSAKTDWDIIREWASEFYETHIIPGLKSNQVVGEVKWSNPLVKNTLNVANALLMNADGQARVCFKPNSDYASGGVSASVANTETLPSGKIDEKPDRSEDRETARTHWLDTVRYVLWWFSEGAFMGVDAFENALDDMKEVEKAVEEGIQVPGHENPERYSGWGDEDRWEDDSNFGAGTDLII